MGPRLSWAVVLVAILLSGALLGAGITGDTRPNANANLPADSESARVAEIRDRLATAEVTPAIVVFDRGGDPLTAADRRAVTAKVAALAELAAPGQRPFPVYAEDGRAAFVGVPLAADIPEEELEGPVQAIRDEASAGLPDGLRTQVTGGPAFVVDLSKVFDGADTRLLAVTAGVVALLLLVTYRSPWLWLVPLAVVGTADQVAATALELGTKVLPFASDGATVGITSVLVFGAGTNYALLLIARYREELRRHEDRYQAMRVALRRAAPAILASSGTVVLALLCLALAASPSTVSIGYAGAIGIAVAVGYALLVLPAAMTIFGRRLFWPFVPRVGQEEPTRSGAWARVARVVTARPVAVSVAAGTLLVALAVPLTGAATGLSQTEQFRTKPESVTGQEVLSRYFPAGSSQPTSVIASPDRAAAVRAAVSDVEGVRSVRPGGGDGEYAELTVVLAAEPASQQAFDTVERVRQAATSADADALVGGPDAEGLDAEEAAAGDQRLLIPMILGVVVLVLLLLLQSVVAAVVLVLSVVATYVSSLGAGWWAFTEVLDFPALDLSVPLLGFLFLVALGVDYNIFLITRAREEAFTSDTRTAVSTALAVTGGVITSAGILLAAVFTVLGVLPLITLTQLGIIVGFGVLLDTLLVRSVLVPALVALLGRRFWWPGALSRGPERH